MLECTVKRTHKFWLAFFLVALVVQGVFLMAPAVSADTPSQGGDKSQWDFKPGPTENAANASPNNTSTSAPQADNKPPSSTDSCFSNLTKCLLVDPINAFTRGLGFVAGGAAILFVWMVQPENISGPGGIMNKESVYNLWAFVRDFFNVFFILILLFSAFATIFQVENFSIRKIFLNILLAALIINFSFPITRFLIDLTNVPMYYFLNAILPGTDGGQAFTETFLGSTGMSGLQVLSAPDLPRALIALVFTFLFMISLLVLAILFLVRFIALTLLLILSPIGFAASLLPGLQSAGSKWWEKFWQYALFGPSAAFMMLIAMRFQNEIATDGTVGSFNRVSTPMTAGSGDANILALMGFYIIPLILIWTAIGMANSSSIAGASFVTGLGYGVSKKVGRYVGGKVTGYDFVKNAIGTWSKQREAARSDAKDRMWSTRLGKWAAGKQNQVVATSGLTKAQRSDAQARVDVEVAKKVKEAAEKMSELGVAELERISQTGDKYQKAAAAQKLVEKAALDMSNAAHAGLVQGLKNTFGETSTVFRQLNNKLRQYDPVAAFNNITKNADGTPMTEKQKQERLREYINTNEFDSKKLGASSLGNADFMRMLVEEQAVSMKDLEDMARKSDRHKDNIKNSLGTIASADYAETVDHGPPTPWLQNKKKHQMLQEANFNMNGQLNNTLTSDSNWRRDVFGKLNKDFGSNMQVSVLQAGHARDIAESINPNKYKEWITSLKNKEAARMMNKFILTADANGDANFEALKKIAQEDSFLRGLR